MGEYKSIAEPTEICDPEGMMLVSIGAGEKTVITNDVTELIETLTSPTVNYCPAVEQSTVCTSRNSAKLCRSLIMLVYHDCR